MLIGGGTGAGLGALAGGLSASGGISPDKYNSMVDELKNLAEEARVVGQQAGKDAGREAAIHQVGTNPDMANAILKAMAPEVRQQAVSPSIVKDVLRNMEPGARDDIIKSFHGGFGNMLRRWFGG